MKYCPYCGHNMGRKKQCPSCGRARIKTRSLFGLILLLLALAIGFVLGMVASGYRPDLSSPNAALSSFTVFLQTHRNAQEAPLMSDSTAVSTPTAAPTAAPTNSTSESGGSMTLLEDVPAQTTAHSNVSSVVQKATVTPVPRPTATPTPKPAVTAKPASSPQSGVVTPSFKKAMDDYEAFIDEYVTFMKKYKSTANDLSLTATYFTMYSRYEKSMRELETIKDDELSNADRAYYEQTMYRINSKLMTISY